MGAYVHGIASDHFTSIYEPTPVLSHQVPSNYDDILPGGNVQLLMMDSLVFHLTTRGSLSGWGTGMCPLIGPGFQRMDPVHVPATDYRHCVTTTT